MRFYIAICILHVFLLFSLWVVSVSLWPYGLLQTRPPCFPHHLLEFAQVHVQVQVCELVLLSNHLILCHSLLFLPSIFSSITIFSNESVLHIRWPKSIGASASSSVLPMNSQDWFPLGLTSLISLVSKGFSRVLSNTTVQKHQFFGAQPSYGSTLTSIHDYWKNHRFDYTELCWQSDVFAF